jgi:Beta-mannanase
VGGERVRHHTSLLYNLLFERLTTYHSLNNLIWVWNSDGADANWYPGANYVDIIGRDFYYDPEEKNHASLIGEFEKLKGLFGTTKMIALAENGSVPYPENLKADGASWSYFMPWYGKYTNSSKHNVASDWNKIMNDSYVITLEGMPDWDSYTPSDPAPILKSRISTLNSQPITYYSIKGEPLGNVKPQKAGVYIAKQGSSVKKIVVRQ